MATQTVIGSGAKKNNGGVILLGGTIASTRWTNITYSTNSDPREFNNRLIPASTAHMVKPYSSGVYGSMEAGQYVVRFMGTKLAQVATDAVRIPGSAFFRMPIRFKESERRLDHTSWNAVTGAVTKGANAGNSYNFGNIDSGTFIDQAAHPSRAVPGELVFLVTGNEATMTDYSAITGK